MIDFILKDYWNIQTLTAEMLVCFWLSLCIGKKINFLTAITFFYFSCYGLYAKAFDTELSLVLAIIPFVFCKEKNLKNWLCIFQWGGIVSCPLMVYHKLTLHKGMGLDAWGLMGAASVDAVFLAILLPMILFSDMDHEDKVLKSLLFVITILVAGSSTAYGALCLEAILFTIYKLKRTFLNYSLLSIGSILTVPIGYLLLGNELFCANGRMQILKSSFHVFNQVGNYLFGLGPGSFISVMPIIQGTTHEFFIFLHNDPLQVFFEQGLVGFVLLIVLFCTMLWMSRKNMGLFITLAATGFESFFQMPFRYFPTALFCAFLCRSAFENNVESTHMKGIL